MSKKRDTSNVPELCDVIAGYLQLSGPCRVWVVCADLQMTQVQVKHAILNNSTFVWGRDYNGPLVGVRHPQWLSQQPPKARRNG